MNRAALMNGTAVAGGLRQCSRTKLAWMSADELKPGDTVITCDGRRATIRSVNRGAGLSTVHNFAVDGHHTYFVGEGRGVWVHNQYKIDMPDEMYDAIRAEHGEDVANLRAREWRQTEILKRLGITDQDQIDEINRVHGETLAQRQLDDDYRTRIGPQSGPIRLELDGRRQLARALGFAGYTDAEALVNANYGRDQLFFEAILATDPTMVSASTKLAGARMYNDSRNLMLQDNLTVQEFNIVASVGLWKNFVGVSTLPSGDSSAGDWNEAELEAIYVAPPTTAPTTPGDVAASLNVRKAVADTAASLVYGRNSGTSRAERGLVFSYDSTGALGISQITIGSETANAYISYTSSRHAAFVHAHRASDVVQTAGPGDNNITRAVNRPTFVVNRSGSRITEVGRQAGDYRIRSVDSSGGVGSWQHFVFGEE